MATNDFLELLKALLARTQAKKVKWLLTTETSVFRIALGDGIVRIESAFDDERDQYYSATLLNRKGRVLEELAQFRQAPNWPLLDNLFSSARHSALSVDDILASMFKDLEEGKTQKPPDDDTDNEPPF